MFPGFRHLADRPPGSGFPQAGHLITSPGGSWEKGGPMACGGGGCQPLSPRLPHRQGAQETSEADGLPGLCDVATRESYRRTHGTMRL